MTAAEEGVIREAQRQRPDARHDPRLEWWRDARFGMFIHWGLYAIPAGVWRGEAVPGIGEWIMLRRRVPVREYEQLATRFNPTGFDAAAWVALARRAGQRYLVITAKHHDGFCLYDSRVSDYDVVDATPYGRDPIKALAEECAKQGIKLGFYYSQTQDWHHPGGDGNDWDYDEATRDFDGYLEHYVKPQVRELLTGYGPICLIWFDTPKRISAQQSRELVDLVHELQPECLVNGRIGNALGDYAEARDNGFPDALVDADWETPATINDTWGFKTGDHNWKAPEDLIRKLVDVASKGGNYLLNVGPTAEGVIPQPSADRLLAVGAWLERNGAAVYDTRPGPVQGAPWGRSTVALDRESGQPRRVFLHVFDWPAGGRLEVPLPAGLAARVSGAALLAAPDAALPLEPAPQGLTVRVPASAPDAVDTVVVLDVRQDGRGMKITALELIKVPPSWVWLKLHTDEGLVGLGEPYLEGHPDSVIAEVRRLEPLLLGEDPRRIEYLWDRMYTAGGHYRGGPVTLSAISGIDIALWDVAGKAAGQPVHRLLGGAYRDRVLVYHATGGAPPHCVEPGQPYRSGGRRRRAAAPRSEPADFAAAARTLVQEWGYRCLKTHLGLGERLEATDRVPEIVERFAAVRAGAGPEIPVAIDVHNPLPSVGVQLITALAPLRPLFIEEPMPVERVEALAQMLRGQPGGGAPVAAGERWMGKWTFFDALSRGLLAVVQPDLCHAGGITECKKIAAMAEAAYAQVALHCPLSPLAFAASVQLDAALPNFLVQEHNEVNNWREDGRTLIGKGFFKEPFALDADGCVRVPDGPGLGVELDEAGMAAIMERPWSTNRG